MLFSFAKMLGVDMSDLLAYELLALEREKMVFFGNGINEYMDGNSADITSALPGSLHQR
jgi:hypothetical protein